MSFDDQQYVTEAAAIIEVATLAADPETIVDTDADGPANGYPLLYGISSPLA